MLCVLAIAITILILIYISKKQFHDSSGNLFSSIKSFNLCEIKRKFLCWLCASLDFNMKLSG